MKIDFKIDYIAKTAAHFTTVALTPHSAATVEKIGLISSMWLSGQKMIFLRGQYKKHGNLFHRERLTWWYKGKSTA